MAWLVNDRTVPFRAAKRLCHLSDRKVREVAQDHHSTLTLGKSRHGSPTVPDRSVRAFARSRRRLNADRAQEWADSASRSA